MIITEDGIVMLRSRSLVRSNNNADGIAELADDFASTSSARDVMTEKSPLADAQQDTTDLANNRS